MQTPNKRAAMKAVNFQPIQKKRYSEQISEQIREKILRESISVGTLLPTELELAAEFQVSRTVIREALRILEVSGLVNIKKGPTGGIFVTDAYAKPIKTSLSNLVASGEVNLEHLFDVRLMIEPQIAREAALNATFEDLEAIRELFSDSEAHMDDTNRLKINNLNFHLLLSRASGNPILAVLLEAVIHTLIELSLEFRDAKQETYFYEVHKGIFEAIENRDGQTAEERMRADLLDIQKELNTVIGKKPSSARKTISKKHGGHKSG